MESWESPDRLPGGNQTNLKRVGPPRSFPPLLLRSWIQRARAGRSQINPKIVKTYLVLDEWTRNQKRKMRRRKISKINQQIRAQVTYLVLDE